jgi:hypothetical protein
MVSIKVYTSNGQCIEVSIQNIDDVQIALGGAGDETPSDIIFLTKEEWLKICKHIEGELADER